MINRRKVAKPFEIAITDDDFHFQRKPAAIAAEAALDGIYVLRTSLTAYHLEWHMRRALAPMLFDDHQRDAAEAERLSPVAKAKVSPAARRKAAAKKTDDGLAVHSFRSLLADLATLTRNTVAYGKRQCMTILAKPTPTQKRALKLLDIKLAA